MEVLIHVKTYDLSKKNKALRKELAQFHTS
jgi:hypothetical protein